MSSTITDQVPTDQSTVRNGRRNRYHPHSLPSVEATNAHPS